MVYDCLIPLQSSTPYYSWENNPHAQKYSFYIFDVLIDDIYPLNRIKTWTLLGKYILSHKSIYLVYTWHTPCLNIPGFPDEPLTHWQARSFRPGPVLSKLSTPVRAGRPPPAAAGEAVLPETLKINIWTSGSLPARYHSSKLSSFWSSISKLNFDVEPEDFNIEYIFDIKAQNIDIEGRNELWYRSLSMSNFWRS